MKKLIILFLLFIFYCQTEKEIVNPKCEEGLVFQFKSKLPLSTKLYNCELIDEETGDIIQSFQSMINNNQFVKINDLDKGKLVKLKIKDIDSNNIAISNVVESCNLDREIIDVTSFVLPSYITKGEVKVTLLFPCAEIDTKNYLLLNYIHVVK